MLSSAKISMVDASDGKAAVTLHRGAGMSPVNKQGARGPPGRAESYLAKTEMAAKEMMNV